MSTFQDALPTILAHEGGFVDDPRDAGGATNFGVSLRYLVRVGDLDGDGFAEGDFDKDGDVDAADIRAMTEAQAAAIYKSQWWDRYRYGDIHDQAVATKVFDLSVNMGPVRAHSLLQQALRSADKPVPVDGEMGPKTIAAVNAAEPRILLAALRSEAGGFYRKLDKRAFLAGWLRRAYS